VTSERSGIDENVLGHHRSSHRVPHVGICSNSAQRGTWSELDRYRDVSADRLGNPRNHLSIIGKHEIESRFLHGGPRYHAATEWTGDRGRFPFRGGVSRLRRTRLFEYESLLVEGSDQGRQIRGLNDRDVTIKRPNQPRLFDGLVAILQDRKTGIHISELRKSNLLTASGITAEALFSLTSFDSRLKVSPSQNLYLNEWGGPRRESISDAVEHILASAEKALSVDEILEQAEVRIRRQCDRAALMSCLRALEAQADTSGCWLMPLNASEIELSEEQTELAEDREFGGDDSTNHEAFTTMSEGTVFVERNFHDLG
jgi:hypothetical protein